MTPCELKEMNAWIAEHVFGWRREMRKRYAGEGNVTGFGLNQHLPIGAAEREFIPLWGFPNTPYATDPAAAMQVLDKCVDKDRIVTISRYGKVTIVGSPSSSVDLVRGETLPLAICLFAKQLFSK